MTFRIPRATVIVTCALAVFFSNGSNATELFVSIRGPDSNAGTSDAPLTTLAGARREVGNAKLLGSGPVTIKVEFAPDGKILVAKDQPAWNLFT